MKDNFDFERIWESKRALRERLTTAPIIEKLRMLDALHERAAPFAVPDFAKQPLFKKNREATATGKKRRLDLSTP